MMDRVPIDELLGRTFTKVYQGDRYNRYGERGSNTDFNADGIIFEHEGVNIQYMLAHRQDCCEDVNIEDICGDLEDLQGSPIVLAKETHEEGRGGDGRDSSTWTFYHISTIKGGVVIRFYGTSNGFYSEEAHLYRCQVG